MVRVNSMDVAGLPDASPGRLSPGDARPRGAEAGAHSDENGQARCERGQGGASGAAGDLPSASPFAQGDRERPPGPLAGRRGPATVADGYPVIEDHRSPVRVPDVDCCEGHDLHGSSLPMQGSHSEHSHSSSACDPREQGATPGVVSPMRDNRTGGGEAHAQLLGMPSGAGQAALRMRTPSRHLRQAALDRGVDSCAAQDAGAGALDRAGSAVGPAEETVGGAREGAREGAAAATSASPGSPPVASPILSSSAPGVAATLSFSHVSPLALLTRHLRPGPLLLCFFLGLGLGLLLAEPQGTPALDLAIQEKVPSGVALSGMPGLDVVRAVSSGSTGAGRWDQAVRGAQGRNTDNTEGTGQGVRNDTGAAQALSDAPSAEQRALEAVGTGGVGQCAAYHRVNVTSLAPVAGGPWPLLLIVTPTYVRPFQAMYLRRLANLLRLVAPPLLWIVVEIGQQSAETAALLRSTGLQTRHIVTSRELRDIKDRGVNQRNAALEYIEEHRLDGIVYFADDDNVYSPALFLEIRKVRRFGTWPVALMQQGKSRAIVEGPVCQGPRVVGWHTNEKSKRVRRFHVDMSGFAFNSTVLWQPQLFGRPTSAPIRQLDTVKEGFQETTFIEQLVPDESQMEGLANGCTEVLVWHLHSEAPATSPFPRWSSRSKVRPVVPARTRLA